MWQEWTGGKIDGRALKQRHSSHIVLEGVTVHSLKFENGDRWDCINGWTSNSISPPQNSENQPAIIEQLPKPINPATIDARAQALALRIWDGQSPDLHRPDRLRRVAEGLAKQGLSMEGVELP